MKARAVDTEVTVIDRLYRTHARALYWVALALTDDEASAEDAVHEAFLYLCEHREEFHDVRDPFPYLAAITKHRILDARKHIAVVQAHEGRVAYEIENSADIPLSEKLETLEAQKARAKEILSSLPPKAREVFLKSVVDGMSYKAIADDLGVSVNTVKTELRLARKKIADQVRRKDLFLLALLILYRGL